MVIKTVFEDSDSVSTSTYGQDGIQLNVEQFSFFQSAVQEGEELEEDGVEMTDCEGDQATMCKLMPPIIQSTD
jgi:hypothetical protein